MARELRVSGHGIQTTARRVARAIERSKRAGVQFLLVDIDLACTMLERAQQSSSRATARRNVANARRARDTVARFLRKIDLGERAAATVRARLAELDARLARQRERERE